MKTAFSFNSTHFVAGVSCWVVGWGESMPKRYSSMVCTVQQNTFQYIKVQYLFCVILYCTVVEYTVAGRWTEPSLYQCIQKWRICMLVTPLTSRSSPRAPKSPLLQSLLCFLSVSHTRSVREVAASSGFCVRRAFDVIKQTLLHVASASSADQLLIA